MATEADNEAEIGRLLHVRMLADDAVAFDEIYLRYGQQLTDSVRGYIVRANLFLRHDDIDELAEDAAIEALRVYAANPQAFNPSKRSLLGYLRMSALGDFKNAFDRAIKQDAGVVRIGDERWNRMQDEGSDFVAEHEEREAHEEFRDRALALCETDEERTVMELMIAGERSTERCAKAMGIGQLSAADQQARVVKVKGRLTKRLQRSYRGPETD